MTEEYRGETKQSHRSALAAREVKFLFNGLFFFSFPNAPEGQEPPHKREFCTAGMLSTRGDTKDHALFIRYRQDGRPSEPIEVPHSVLSKLSEEIEITKTPAPTTNEVTIRGAENIPSGWGERSASDRLDRTITPDYFNWIIDFESLHAENLAETPGSLRPKLKFRVGDFHTHLVSSDKYFKRHRGVETLFGYVAATIGARIVLTDAEQLILNLNGVPNPLPMNVTEIHLNNVRPEHMKAELEAEKDAELQSHSKGNAPHGPHDDDMEHDHDDDTQIYYYDLLQGVAPGERVHFRPEPKAKGEKLKFNPPFICFGSGGGR